ncbi:MAG: hypothetical protein RMK21_00990 [Aquificaceae bacterium]|nr:hypothetical protein [Aquificaceae bacterium]
MLLLDIDFRGVRASEGRHSIHDYPAMLHHKLVDYLLETYGKDKKALYDPFCGSGVSLVQALKKGLTAYGTDINPLALLIAQTRAYTPKKPIPTKDLIESIQKAKPDVPEVRNISYWFKESVIEELGKIRSAVKKYAEEDFFLLILTAFSQTVRLSSNNRRGEFKRFRLSEEELRHFDPKPIKIFLELVVSYQATLKEDPIETSPNLLLHNVRLPIPFKGYDMVITSPPYGDSRTTVAYGQFSSFSLEWLSGMNPFGSIFGNLDRMSLGGEKRSASESVYSESFQKIYKFLMSINKRRAQEVHSFFSDLQKCCKNIVHGLEEGGIVCFVVGNRRVAGVEIPTSDIVKELFESFGLYHVQTLHRNIHNKRMPLMNSPSNVTGQKEYTMRSEHIVVMKKP